MSFAFRPRLEMMENRETPTTFPVDPSMPPENPPADQPPAQNPPPTQPMQFPPQPVPTPDW